MSLITGFLAFLKLKLILWTPSKSFFCSVPIERWRILAFLWKKSVAPEQVFISVITTVFQYIVVHLRTDIILSTAAMYTYILIVLFSRAHEQRL